jgi:hypothetical protein
MMATTGSLLSRYKTTYWAQDDQKECGQVLQRKKVYQQAEFIEEQQE